MPEPLDLAELKRLSKGGFHVTPDAVLALIERLEKAEAREPLYRDVIGKFVSAFNPLWMTFVERDMVDDPIPGDAVVLSFMGSGGSDYSTAEDIRAAYRALDALPAAPKAHPAERAAPSSEPSPEPVATEDRTDG